MLYTLFSSKLKQKIEGKLYNDYQVVVIVEREGGYLSLDQLRLPLQVQQFLQLPHGGRVLFVVALHVPHQAGEVGLELVQHVGGVTAAVVEGPHLLLKHQLAAAAALSL